MFSKMNLRCGNKAGIVKDKFMFFLMPNRVSRHSSNLSYTNSRPMSESRAQSVTAFYNQSAIDRAALKVSHQTLF